MSVDWSQRQTVLRLECTDRHLDDDAELQQHLQHGPQGGHSRQRETLIRCLHVAKNDGYLESRGDDQVVGRWACPIPDARIQLYKAPMHKRESSHAYSDETKAKKMKKDEDASRMSGDGGKNPVANPGKKIARAGNENAKPGLEADASVKRVDELEKKVAELTSKAASFQKREKEFNDDKERVYKFMLDRNSSRRGVESGTDDAGRRERDYNEIKEEVYKFMKDRQSTRSASGCADA
jgi:hypothetical protein